MNHTYKTKGTCSSQITFDLDGNTVRNVHFTGGCNGNLKAIARLVEGMDADRVIELLRGNTCGYKNTSCADQLALAITEALSADRSAS